MRLNFLIPKIIAVIIKIVIEYLKERKEFTEDIWLMFLENTSIT